MLTTLILLKTESVSPLLYIFSTPLETTPRALSRAPKPTSTQTHLYTNPPLPKPASTQTRLYPNLPLPKPTSTQTHLYPNPPLPKPTSTQTYLYPNPPLPKPTSTQTRLYPKPPLPKPTSTQNSNIARLQEEDRLKVTADQPDDEGWVTITKYSRNKGAQRTESNDKRIKHSEKIKRKEKVNISSNDYNEMLFLFIVFSKYLRNYDLLNWKSLLQSYI